MPDQVMVDVVPIVGVVGVVGGFKVHVSAIIGGGPTLVRKEASAVMRQKLAGALAGHPSLVPGTAELRTPRGAA